MQKGTLTVITGCMFSGKTSMLISLAEKAKSQGKSAEVFYPENDTRTEKNFIRSHSDLSHQSKALPLSVSKISNEAFDKVFIDEAQFFEESIIGVVRSLLEQAADVIVGGLDKDFRGEPFPTIARLVTIADEVIRLEAICAVCQEPATFSQRLVESDETILIGGKNEYESRCEEHFIKPQ